jgi:hypothetical protein
MTAVEAPALEASMPRLVDEANKVTVSFKDAAVMFDLPPRATLADIALRIAEVAERHLAAPVAVNVKLRH